VSYVDLRPNRVRPIQVKVADGQWTQGWLELYQQSSNGWAGYVRYSVGSGQTRVEWLAADRVREV